MENLPKRLAISGGKTIVSKLKSISGGKILDVATESGEFIQTLMKTLKDYESFVGIDISKNELKSAKKQFQNEPVELTVMNAETLGFENNSFDTVCISYSFHHLENIDRVLAEMKRVLKSDGYFLIQECFCDGEQTEAQKTEILRHHWIAEIDSLLGIPHYKTLTKQKLKSIVSSLRLKEVEIFESTHPVKCLFCEDKFECDDPKNEKFINQSIKGIDDELDRLTKHLNVKPLQEDPNVKLLQEEGKKLKVRIRKFGISLASHLFCVGKK